MSRPPRAVFTRMAPRLHQREPTLVDHPGVVRSVRGVERDDVCSAKESFEVGDKLNGHRCGERGVDVGGLQAITYIPIALEMYATPPPDLAKPNETEG